MTIQRDIAYVMLVHGGEGVQEYIDVHNRTDFAPEMGRKIYYVAGRGCGHLKGENILHVDVDDSYEDGLAFKKAEGFRRVLELEPDVKFIVKLDPDTVVFKGYEELVRKINVDLMGGGTNPLKNVPGCCVAYSRIAAEAIVLSVDDEIKDFHPDDMSWETVRIGSRDRIYSSEDIHATRLINAGQGLRTHSNAAICIGHHTQVLKRPRTFTVTFMELSAQAIEDVWNAEDRLSCLNKAMDNATICQKCDNRVLLKRGGQAGVLGAGKCHLTKLTINHLEDDTCPIGAHNEKE